MSGTKYEQELIATANAIAAPGKGILAADESTGTIGKRFANINLDNTETNRRAYRELLFTTKGLGQYISGCILFEETLFQKQDDGTPFVELLKAEGIVPGIKTDKGVAPLFNGAPGKTTTQGHDGLAERCQKYYEAGARFCKWRAVLKIDTTTGAPTEHAIHENVNGLARYAAISQQNGLCPIVEPEILMDGTHDILTARKITEKVLAHTYKCLNDHGVMLEGSLLKPNMVLSGYDNADKASPIDVAYHTVRCLSRTVPAAVPGIMFLSGGQTEEEATVNLNAMNALAGILEKQGKAAPKKPWSLSFSYGRALQQSVLKAWQGKPENKEAAQKELMNRAGANSQANLGKYEGGAGGAAAMEGLHVANYTY